MLKALAEWAVAEDGARAEKFDGYVYGIAQARYVIRKVFRIVDDEAKKAGIDPLHHQALIQAFGSGTEPLTVGGLAARLDIVPALASRVAKELEHRGLVVRHGQAHDRRVVSIGVTSEGRELLQRIDDAVHVHVEYFQSQLTDAQRQAALVILAFYVGLGSANRLGAIMSSSVGPADGS
jgi:DNA-binding MarR family transcriptional regulator